MVAGKGNKGMKYQDALTPQNVALCDGTHRTARWWMEQAPGAPAPFATVQSRVRDRIAAGIELVAAHLEAQPRRGRGGQKSRGATL